MATMLINFESESDRRLFSSLAKRLHLKTRILSEQDKEDYGLLLAMFQGQTGQYIDKQEVIKALRK